MTRGHCVCGKLAPVNADEHCGSDWFRVDLDGRGGEIEPLWICPAHREEPDAELAARLHCALMRAARDRRLVGGAS